MILNWKYNNLHLFQNSVFDMLSFSLEVTQVRVFISGIIIIFKRLNRSQLYTTVIVNNHFKATHYFELIFSSALFSNTFQPKLILLLYIKH